MSELSGACLDLDPSDFPRPTWSKTWEISRVCPSLSCGPRANSASNQKFSLHLVLAGAQLGGSLLSWKLYTRFRVFDTARGGMFPPAFIIPIFYNIGGTLR